MKINNENIVQYSLKKITRKTFEFSDMTGLFFIAERQPHENPDAHTYCQNCCYDATLLLCPIAEYNTYGCQLMWSSRAGASAVRCLRNAN